MIGSSGRFAGGCGPTRETVGRWVIDFALGGARFDEQQIVDFGRAIVQARNLEKASRFLYCSGARLAFANSKRLLDLARELGLGSAQAVEQMALAGSALVGLAGGSAEELAALVGSVVRLDRICLAACGRAFRHFEKTLGHGRGVREALTPEQSERLDGLKEIVRSALGKDGIRENVLELLDDWKGVTAPANRAGAIETGRGHSGDGLKLVAVARGQLAKLKARRSLCARPGVLAALKRLRSDLDSLIESTPSPDAASE